MRRTPASIRSGIRPVSGRAVRRRSRVSRPRPLVRRSRGSSASVRGVRTTDVELGSTRIPPTARATDGRTRAPIGSSAQAGPSRAQPASVPTSTAAASATTTQPKPKTVAAAPATASVARPSSAPQAWASSTMPRCPARPILIRDRQDQPRREVDEHARARAPARRARTRAARARAGRPSARRALRRRRRASVHGGLGRSERGGRSSPSIVGVPLAFTSRDCPERVSGISRSVEYRPCSHDAC